MTKFIDCSGEQKETKKTVFTHYLDNDNGWQKSELPTTKYEKILYLGECHADGDMFACYENNHISIYKGTKGNEF